jgi:hypothetical protein
MQIFPGKAIKKQPGGLLAPGCFTFIFIRYPICDQKIYLSRGHEGVKIALPDRSRERCRLSSCLQFQIGRDLIPVCFADGLN